MLNKYLIYTAVIEGMFKTQETIKKGLNFTILNRTVPQAAIKSGANK